MMDVPGLIGPAANNPTPLTRDLRFSHSRFRRFSLISSSHSLIDRILLFPAVVKPAPQFVPSGAKLSTNNFRSRHTVFICGTTLRQMQTSMQQSSILQPRLAAFAPGYQEDPTIR